MPSRDRGKPSFDFESRSRLKRMHSQEPTGIRSICDPMVKMKLSQAPGLPSDGGGSRLRSYLSGLGWCLGQETARETETETVVARTRRNVDRRSRAPKMPRSASLGEGGRTSVRFHRWISWNGGSRGRSTPERSRVGLLRTEHCTGAWEVPGMMRYSRI